LQNRSTSKPVRIFRITRLVIHTLYGALIAVIVLPWVGPRRRDQLISYWARRLLTVLNIRVVIKGVPPNIDTQRTMFVANHISWIDIHALNSIRAVRFIAKAEIRRWLVFGWLAHKVNTLFIERSKRHDTGRIVEIASESLRAGDNLCFFPEGTTTDGSHIKPFKSSLLQAAINAGAQVWPLGIYYPGTDGKPNTQMAYYDDVTLLQSVKQVLAQVAPIVELHFFSPIDATGQERRALLALARQSILRGIDLPG
jgi:1-acyl-sn-glycerol-3-phosphate acyltransferase